MLVRFPTHTTIGPLLRHSYTPRDIAALVTPLESSSSGELTKVNSAATAVWLNESWRIDIRVDLRRWGLGLSNVLCTLIGFNDHCGQPSKPLRSSSTLSSQQ